jgi:dolichol-phosphate mannosyltransferase
MSPPAPDTSEPPEISVVVPAYNERENLEPLLDELRAALATTGRTFEIVAIDDASTDGTGPALAAAARADSRIVPVFLAQRTGQSGALAMGLARVRGSIVVTIDADLQNDPADVPKLLAALADADVVSGIRVGRLDGTVRLVSSAIANNVRRWLLGDRVTDIGCSLKAYRREVIEGIPMFVGVHRFLPALCQFRGARLVEVPVNHRPRLHGTSKYGISNRLWRGLHDVIGVQWLKTRLIRTQLRKDPP